MKNSKRDDENVDENSDVSSGVFLVFVDWLGKQNSILKAGRN
jgi:hypothetical protein